MTTRQRTGAKVGVAIGGVAAGVTVLVLLAQPIRLAGRALFDTPSKAEVSREIGDSLRAHIVADRPWRDSVKNQVVEIRCNIDQAFRARHLDECVWRMAKP